SIYVLFDFLKKRIDVKRFLVLALALLLISSPLLLKIKDARHQMIDVNGDRRYEKAKFLPTLIDELFVISGAYFFDLISFVSYSVLMLGIVIYGAFHQRRHRNLRMTFLLMLFIGMLVMSAFRQMTFFQWRYIGFLVPVFYLSFLVRDRNLFVRLMQYGMLLLTVTSSLYALNNDDNRSIVSYYGWKEVAQFICEQRASHAIVIYPLERLARQSIDYYTRELNLDNMPDIEYLSNSDQLDLHGNRIKIVTLLTDTTKIRDLGTMYRITEDKSLLPFSLFILDKSDGPEIMQFSPDSEGRQCLFIPQGANTTLQVQVPELMMQNKITFLAAINDSMITGYMSPVFIDFFIDGIWQDRLVHPDIRGWLEHDVSTAQYDQERHNLTLSISTDGQRRFCFGLGLSEELAEEFYFYDKLEKAEASVDNGTCRIFIEDPVWPHNEKKPPFLDSKIFGRWDCSGGKELWNAVGRSYAVSGGDFRYAIWFHPVENKTKSVIYALGGNALQRNALGRNISSIKGYFGFNDLSLSKGLKGADTFIIKLDNRTVFNETAAHKPGWSEFSIDIGSLVSTVEFVVKTTDDTWKHFFFNAYIEG
ncbi:MAG: hypothetical protein KKF44_03330, partial [Nanoarchaeota archaeon]|nr:hypothetical protein [Nanoarchaeota archaeon]